MRSILYVPGNRYDFLCKIRELNADIYTLDLEDSVPLNEKPKARKMVRACLENQSGIMYVRINSRESGLMGIDLSSIVCKDLYGVCLTKVNDVIDVKSADTLLSTLEKDHKLVHGKIKIQLLIETPKAIMNVYKLAQSSTRINSLIFGAVDYSRYMGVTLHQPNGVEQTYARYIIPCAAVAVGAKPIDCPYLNFKDKEGFIKDTTFSASIGYKGRLLIHPSQIELANEIYMPSRERIEWAREIVEVFEREALSRGKASIAYNGTMIASAVYNDAKDILKRIDTSHVK